MKLLYTLEKTWPGTKKWFVIHDMYYTNKKYVLQQLKVRKQNKKDNRFRIRIYKLLDKVICNGSNW